MERKLYEVRRDHGLMALSYSLLQQQQPGHGSSVDGGGVAEREEAGEEEDRLSDLEDDPEVLVGGWDQGPGGGYEYVRVSSDKVAERHMPHGAGGLLPLARACVHLLEVLEVGSDRTGTRCMVQRPSGWSVGLRVVAA